ncbi:hypothetical protein, partial [Tritonibacter mobilis]|uniref:hypothetical protein n=1 Tax=Tritonibacter mobilis TaxID=379347 RepID=UPI001A965B30
RSTCIAKRRDPIDLCHHAVATIRVHVLPNLAGVLMTPARVDAMFRDTTRGSSRASASSATSRPLASCAADDVLGAHHPQPVPMRMGRTLTGWVEG